MKKFLILILICIICFSTFCFANEKYINEATYVLNKMKIVIGNEKR